MPYFNIVAETNENTVVTEYEPLKHRSDQYQSEADLEKEFIRMLCEQGYEYLPIHTEEFSTGLKLRIIIKNMEILQPVGIFGIPQDLERLLHRLKLQD